MDKYCVIGNVFCMGSTGRTFQGPCVLAPDDIHLIVIGDSARNQLHTDMRGIAGIMERVGGVVQLAPIPGLDAFELTMGGLAAKIGDDPQWPVHMVGEKAFSFPKRSIDRLRFGALGGLNFRAAGGIRVNVSCPMGRRQPGVAYLQHHAWDLDTRSFLGRLRGQAA